jgi:hypothetical protein
MRTPRDRIPILWSLHRTSCRPLTFPLSLEDTPESTILMSPDVLTAIVLLADDYVVLTFESEDFSFAPPVRARRALAQKRLPSC